MQNILAKSFLILFHPFTVPIWTVLLIFSSGSYLSFLSIEIKQMVLYVLSFATILLPMLSLSFFYFSKIAPNIFQSGKNEKRIFYAVLSFSFLFAWNILNRLPISKYILYAILILTLSFFIHTIVLFFSKTSMHLVGWGSATAIILALALKMHLDFYGGIILLLLISGISGSLLLKLERAKAFEVYSGFVSGFSWVFLLAMWFF